MKPSVVIVGGGPAGSACAIELKKAGYEPTIVEKEEMPRFHIGESMTGECGASVRKLGLDIEAKMAEGGFPVKYGTIVFGQGGKNSFYVPVMGRDKNDELFDQTTWQVRRSSFDKMLFDSAKETGVNVVKGNAVGVIQDGDKVVGVKVSTPDGEQQLDSDMLVDASGQFTFLARQGITSEREPGNYGKQIGIFGHFKKAVRNEGKEHKTDDTLIFYRERHQWAWFIPIDDEIVSIGVVVPFDVLKSKKMPHKEFLLSEMKSINPELEWRVQDAELVGDVRSMSNYSYQVKQFTGKGFMCAGDSHRFIDPIFSLGLHFALHEGRHSAKTIIEYFENPDETLDNPFLEHQAYCDEAQDIIQTMLDAFWDYPLAFSLYLKAKKYREGFIDMFAGRVYDAKEHEGVKALQKLNEDGRRHKMQQSLQAKTA